MKIRMTLGLLVLAGISGVWAADDIRNQPNYNPATNGIWNVDTNNWGEHSYRTNAYRENRRKWSESSTNAMEHGTNAWNHATNSWDHSH
jgi:hypothetical protein